MRHAKNIGPHGSFNEGIDLARADYFMILCADDVLAPGALPLALAALEANRQASCAIGTYAGSGARDPHQAVTGTAAYTLLPGAALIARACRSSGRGIPAHSMLVRRTVQHKVGHYRPSLPYMDDLELLLRFARVGPIVELAMPLAVQRYHKGNLSEEIWATGCATSRNGAPSSPASSTARARACPAPPGSTEWRAAGWSARHSGSPPAACAAAISPGRSTCSSWRRRSGAASAQRRCLPRMLSAFPESADGKPS